MELDHVAQDIVLQSLKSALPTRWNDKITELKQMIAGGIEPTIANFLHESGLDLGDIYTNNKSWSDYLEAANVDQLKTGPKESVLRRAVGRLLHIDDETRLDFYIKILDHRVRPQLENLSVLEFRLLRMLVAAACEQALENNDLLTHGVSLLWEHPQVVNEMRELFLLRRKQIDHIHTDLPSHKDVPLRIHSKYSRIEILAAFGLGETAKTRPWREGVLWIQEESGDGLAFTLDKSEGNFSPTTMYRDYAINRELIHWESQSNTRSSSPTGQRYCNHAVNGSHIMLFARENTEERSFWFLGPATYVDHQSEKPMAITWKLSTPLPGDLYSTFAAAVA